MSIDYCEKYKFLKRKLKVLIYEHESLTQELEKSQRKLLKVARDNSFLLDRLLQYEQVVYDSPNDSDATLSSDSEIEEPPSKKRNLHSSSNILKSIKQENDIQDKLQVIDIQNTETENSVEKVLQDSAKESELDVDIQDKTIKLENEEADAEVAGGSETVA